MMGANTIVELPEKRNEKKKNELKSLNVNVKRPNTKVNAKQLKLKWRYYGVVICQSIIHVCHSILGHSDQKLHRNQSICHE